MPNQPIKNPKHTNQQSQANLNVPNRLEIVGEVASKDDNDLKEESMGESEWNVDSDANIEDLVVKDDP